MPNRYASFQQARPKQHETPKDRLRVTRLPLPCHKSGMIDQAVSFLAFAIAVWKKVRGQHYDLVVASSSRLMTAFLASRVAALTKARLYLDIRDIFVETMEDVFPFGLFHLVRPFISFIEKWTYSKAYKINLISPGFTNYFSNLSKIPVTMYTHGIDEEFFENLKLRNAKKEKDGPLTITYAGNIGQSQGLEKILPQLATHLKGKARFVVIGDGGRRRQLQAELARQKSENVVWYPPVQRKELIAKYLEADVLFLHLNNYPAFRRVLPSKIFEYAATGKPIWAGLCGFSKKFVKKNIENCAVFESENVAEAISKFDDLNLNTKYRKKFIEKYRRRLIDEKMSRSILNCLKQQ